jgi:chromosome segregation ATPase
MLNLDGLGVDAGSDNKAMVVANTYDLDIIRPRFEDYKAEAARIATDAKALVVKDDESLNAAVMLGGNAKKIAKAIDVQRKEITFEYSEFVKGVNGIAKQITDSLDEAEKVAKQKIGQHQARIEMERRKAEEAARKAAAELQAKLKAEADEANRKAREEAAAIARAEIEARQKADAEARAKKDVESKSDAEARAIREAEEVRAAIENAEAEAKKHEIEAPTVIAPVIPETRKAVRTESASAHQRKVWSFEVTDAAQVPNEYKLVDDALIRDAVKMGIRAIPGVRIFEETKTVFRT